MENRGRPSAFIPEKLEVFFKALREGNHRTTSCRVAGINYQTLKKWMRRPEGQFREFQNRVKQIESLVETECVETIMTQAKDSPKWAAWYLKSKFPERWNISQKHEVEQLWKHVKLLMKQLHELTTAIGPVGQSSIATESGFDFGFGQETT